MVLLSKSLSGFGLPFALVLLKPELDVWDPGEHNGTFRGHNLAFVTAVEALKRHWSEVEGLEPVVKRKGAVVEAALDGLVRRYPDRIADSRGRGLIHGLEFRDPEDTAAVAARCFEEGLVIETSGPDGEVLKVLPPLTIDDEDLRQGLAIIDGAVSAVVESTSPAGSAA
jgi:diaminobutyrate-2-oxoglutarate transaminase